jgi:hypothetical protein
MSLTPIVFGEQYYPFGIIAILLFFALSVLVFVKICLASLLGVEKKSAAIFAIIVAITLIELIYSPQQNIYWYNPAAHYTFMHGCLFFLLAVLVKLLSSKKYISPKTIALVVVSLLLAVACGGSNYVTALVGIVAVFSIIVLSLIRRNKKGFLLLPCLLVYGISLFINMTAPGNARRGAYFEGFGAVKSVLLSFRSAWEMLWILTGWSMIIAMVMAVPVIWNMVKESAFRFPLPGLLALYSFCLYAAGFTPSYYAMGSAGVARTMTVIGFTLQVLLFANEIYFLGWLNKKLKRSGRIPHYILFYAAGAVSILVVFKTVVQPIDAFSSFGAYYYVKSGEAPTFYEEYQERVETIKSSEPVVELVPYSWIPSFLHGGQDFSHDSWASQNRFLARWYGKEAVIVRNAEEN